MRKFFIFVILISFAFSSFALAEGEKIGEFRAVQGRVDVLHASNTEDVKARQDDPVFLGDIVRTKSNSKTEIVFDDKSILRIAPNSRIEIEKYIIDARGKRQDAIVKLYRGKIRAIVSKKGASSTFHIVTPTAKGTVKGTDIFAMYQADSTGIFVRRGSMSVYNPEHPGEVVRVGKGSSVRVPASGGPKDLRPYSEAELVMYEKETKPVSLIRKKLLGKGVVKLKGSVTSMEGDVVIFPKNGNKGRKVKMDEIISEGDRIVTQENGKVEITLDNGNKLSLNSSSEIIIKNLKQDTKTGNYENTFESDYGKIKAIVEKIGSKSTFEVKTPNAVCGVRGTIMYLDIVTALTTAYYEGGDGFMMSLISGLTEDIGPGQHSSADMQGNLLSPLNTTRQQRMAFVAAWGLLASGGDLGDLGQNTPGANLPHKPVGGKVIDPRLIQKLLAGSGLSPGILGKIPFRVYENETSEGGTTTREDFYGPFGNVLPGPLATSPDDAYFSIGGGTVAGDPTVNNTGFGGAWVTETTTSNRVKGRYSGWLSTRRVWQTNPQNFQHTASSSDGQLYGKIIGRAGGNVTGVDCTSRTVRGKLVGIYSDSSGRGGTFSSFFRGSANGDTFDIGSVEEKFNSRGPINVAPGALFTAATHGADLLNNVRSVSSVNVNENNGEGSFDSTGGAIVFERLGGEALSLDGKRWGTWWVVGNGTFTGRPTGPGAVDWTLAVSGKHQPLWGAPSNTNGGWLATVDGNEWTSDSFTGEFDGHALWKDTDNRVHGVNILNGHLIGSPNVVKWSAVGGAEWAEVTDLLTEGSSGMGFTMSEFNDFVSVPIVEAQSAMMSTITNRPVGYSFDSATFNGHFYNAVDTSTLAPGTPANIWAGALTGTYSGTVPNGWQLDLAGSGGESVNISGDGWNTANGTWHGTIPTNGGTLSDGSTFTGEVGGVFTGNSTDGGTIEGMGTGTWASGGGSVSSG